MIAQVSAIRQIPAGQAVTLTATWYQGDEVADPGTVTVTVTRLGGTVLYEGAATQGAGAAARTFELSAQDTALPDRLEIVWVSDTLDDQAEELEIIGDLLFTLDEARAFDGGAMATLDDETLERYRAMIGDAFEQRCGVAFMRRYRRAVANGTGHRELLLPVMRLRSVRSIETREPGSTTWTAFSAEDLADVIVEPWGRITRETRGRFPRGRQNVRVGYEHGHERVPHEITRAALLVLRDVALRSNIDDRATSYTDEFGSRTFVVTPGIRGALYAVPEVNAILGQYSERVPGIA